MFGHMTREIISTVKIRNISSCSLQSLPSILPDTSLPITRNKHYWITLHFLELHMIYYCHIHMHACTCMMIWSFLDSTSFSLSNYLRFIHASVVHYNLLQTRIPFSDVQSFIYAFTYHQTFRMFLSFSYCK